MITRYKQSSNGVFLLNHVCQGGYIVTKCPDGDKRFKKGHKLLVFQNTVFNLSTGKNEGACYEIKNSDVEVECAETAIHLNKRHRKAGIEVK